MIKKHFNSKLVMTEKYNENFKSSTKCWICDNDYIDRDFRGSARRYCNVNLKLNHKIPVASHDLKSYDSDLIMQEPGA